VYKLIAGRYRRNELFQITTDFISRLPSSSCPQFKKYQYKVISFALSLSDDLSDESSKSIENFYREKLVNYFLE
jgi:hypothetical protein